MPAQPTRLWASASVEFGALPDRVAALAQLTIDQLLARLPRETLERLLVKARQRSSAVPQTV